MYNKMPKVNYWKSFSNCESKRIRAESWYLEYTVAEIHPFTDSWRVFSACSNLNLNFFNGFGILSFGTSNTLLTSNLVISYLDYIIKSRF